MKHSKSIIDVDNWDEPIRECKAALDVDPENNELRGWLYILAELKKLDQREYSPKNIRRGKRDMKSPSAPVRLRTIIGKKQLEFAEMCGIKYETYRAIERKTKQEDPPPDAISAQNAELIALATGVCPRALKVNRLVCADGKTGYDYFIWQTYQIAIQNQHEKLEAQWLALFQDALTDTIRFDEDADRNGSFLKVVRLALLIDQFREIYVEPSKKRQQQRLTDALWSSTNNKIAKAAIGRSLHIKKILNQNLL